MLILFTLLTFRPCFIAIEATVVTFPMSAPLQQVTLQDECMCKGGLKSSRNVLERSVLPRKCFYFSTQSPCRLMHLVHRCSNALVPSRKWDSSRPAKYPSTLAVSSSIVENLGPPRKIFSLGKILKSVVPNQVNKVTIRTSVHGFLPWQ